MARRVQVIVPLIGATSDIVAECAGLLARGLPAHEIDNCLETFRTFTPHVVLIQTESIYLQRH